MVMTRVLRCSWLFGSVMLGLACGSDQPTAPSALPTTTTFTPPTRQPPQGPPAGEAIAAYGFSGPLDHNVRDYTTGSQYLLYENGVFGLRYDAFAGVYFGTYQQANDTIIFRFDNAWTWDQGSSCLSNSRPTGGFCPFAAGALKGDLLEIRYGDSMQHSDFENAVYKRSQ
jgi:hypothetical protein